MLRLSKVHRPHLHPERRRSGSGGSGQWQEPAASRCPSRKNPNKQRRSGVAGGCLSGRLGWPHALAHAEEKMWKVHCGVWKFLMLRRVCGAGGRRRSHSRAGSGSVVSHLQGASFPVRSAGCQPPSRLEHELGSISVLIGPMTVQPDRRRARKCHFTGQNHDITMPKLGRALIQSAAFGPGPKNSRSTFFPPKHLMWSERLNWDRYRLLLVLFVCLDFYFQGSNIPERWQPSQSGPDAETWPNRPQTDINNSVITRAEGVFAWVSNSWKKVVKTFKCDWWDERNIQCLLNSQYGEI